MDELLYPFQGVLGGVVCQPGAGPKYTTIWLILPHRLHMAPRIRVVSDEEKPPSSLVKQQSDPDYRAIQENTNYRN